MTTKEKQLESLNKKLERLSKKKEKAWEKAHKESCRASDAIHKKHLPEQIKLEDEISDVKSEIKKLKAELHGVDFKAEADKFTAAWNELKKVLETIEVHKNQSQKIRDVDEVTRMLTHELNPFGWNHPTVWASSQYC